MVPSMEISGELGRIVPSIAAGWLPTTLGELNKEGDSGTLQTLSSLESVSTDAVVDCGG
jgi:hypothetical protein